MNEQGWQKVCFRESNPLKTRGAKQTANFGGSASPRNRLMARASPRGRPFAHKGQSSLRPFKQNTQREQQQVVLLSANGGPQQRILVSPGWRIEDDLQKLSLTKRFIEQSPKQILKPETAQEIERSLRHHFAAIYQQNRQLNKDLLLSRGEIATQTPANNDDPDKFDISTSFKAHKPPVIVPQTTVIINPSALEAVEKKLAESLKNAPLHSGQINLAKSASPTSLVRNNSDDVPPSVEQTLNQPPARTGTSAEQKSSNSVFPRGKQQSAADQRRETNFSEPSTKRQGDDTQKRGSVQDRTEKTTLHEQQSDRQNTVCADPQRTGKLDSMMSHHKSQQKKERQSVARSIYGGKAHVHARPRRASQDSETESEGSLQQVGVGAMIIVQPNGIQAKKKSNLEPWRYVGDGSNSPVVKGKHYSPNSKDIVIDNSTVIHVTTNDGISQMYSVGSAGSQTRNQNSASKSPRGYNYIRHDTSGGVRANIMNPGPNFAMTAPTVNVALQPGNHSPTNDLRIHSAGFPIQKRLPGKEEHRRKYKEFQAKVKEREEEFKSHNELDFKFMQNTHFEFKDILERLHSQEKARTRKKGEKFPKKACEIQQDQVMNDQNYTQLVDANGNVTMNQINQHGNVLATGSANSNEQSVKDINIKVNDKEIDLPTDGSMSKEKEGFAFKSSVTSIPYHYARSSGLSSHGVKQAAASLSSVLQTRPIKNNFSSSVQNKLSSGQNKKRIQGDGTVMLTPDKQTTELIKGSETLQEQINEIKVQAGNSEQEMQDNQNTLQQVSMDVSYRKGEGASSVDSGLINIKLDNTGKNNSDYPSSNNVTMINEANGIPSQAPSPDSKAPQRKSVLSHLAASRDSVRQKDTKSPTQVNKPLKELKEPNSNVVLAGSDKLMHEVRDKVPAIMKKRGSQAKASQQEGVVQQLRIHHQTTAEIISQQAPITKQMTDVNRELPDMEAFNEQRHHTSNDSVNTNNVVTDGNSVFTQKQLLEKSMDGPPISNIQEFDMQSNRFTEREGRGQEEETQIGDTDRISPTQNSSVGGFGLSYNKLKLKEQDTQQVGLISNVVIKQKKVPHGQSPKKSPIRKTDYVHEDSIFFTKPSSGDNFLRGQSIMWTGADSSNELSLQRNLVAKKSSAKNASFVVVPQVWRRDQHHSQQQQPELDLTVKRTFIVPLNLRQQNSLYFMRDKRGEIQSNPSSTSYNKQRPRPSDNLMAKGSKVLISDKPAQSPSFNATTPQFNTSGFKFSSPSALQLLEMQKTSERTPKQSQRRRSSTLRPDQKGSHNAPSYFFQSNAMSPAENYEQQAATFLKNSQQKMQSLHKENVGQPSQFQNRESPSHVVAIGQTPTKKTPKTSYQSLRGEAYYYHVASPFPQGAKNTTNRLALRTQDGTASKGDILGVVLSTPNASLPSTNNGPPQTPKELQLNSEGNPAYQQQNRDFLKQQRAAAIRRQQIQAAQAQHHLQMKRLKKGYNEDVIPVIQQTQQQKDEQSKHTTESKASQIDFPSQTSQPNLDEEEDLQERYVESQIQKSPFNTQPFSDTGVYSLQRNVENDFSRDLMMIQTPTINGHEQDYTEEVNVNVNVNQHQHQHQNPLNLTQGSSNQFVKTASYADKRNKNLRKWEGRQNQLVRRIERAFGATHVKKRSPVLRAAANGCPQFTNFEQPFPVGNLNEQSVDSAPLKSRSVPRPSKLGTFNTQKRSKWQNLIDNMAMGGGGLPEEINQRKFSTYGADKNKEKKENSEQSCISEHEASITAQLSDTTSKFAKQSPQKELKNQTSWLLPELLHSELAYNSPKKNHLLASKLNHYMFDNKKQSDTGQQVSPSHHKINFLTGAKIFKK